MPAQPLPGAMATASIYQKFGPKPNPRAVITPHGWVDPPFTPGESKAAKNNTPPSSPAKTTANKITKTSKGQSAFDKWLAGKTGGKGKNAKVTDYLAGMPGDEALTAFPSQQTLPDGSSVPYVPGRAFKQGSARLLDPGSYANDAQSAYKPVIDALSGQQSRLSGGIGQANSMIDKSFGDAADSSLRGAQVVQDSNAKANQGLTDLAARLAQVAGGDPTAAAAVGQTVANQQTADTRFANIDAEAQAAEAAAANRDAGTAKLQYKGATDQNIADLAEKVATARTQGAQAKSAALKDALGFNSDQQTAQTSRDVAKQEAWLAGQLAGPQIEAGRLANVGTRSNLIGAKNNSSLNAWSTLNTAKQNKLSADWAAFGNKTTAKQIQEEAVKGSTNPIILALTDPTGAGAAIEKDVIGSMLTNNGPGVDPGTMYKNAIKTMHLEYPDAPSAAVKTLAAQFTSKQMGIWNSQHAKGQKAYNNTWKLVNGVPKLVPIN